MEWSGNGEVEKEVRKLKERIPAPHHQTLERIMLERAQRLYGQAPLVFADELRRVCACILKEESDFETLLEGAFVEMPKGFIYKPRIADCILDSKMSARPLSKHSYGVHAVNMAELEQYFRHGGVFPHYRDGKWRIEVIPYPRCFVARNKREDPPEKHSCESIDEAFMYQDVERTKRLLRSLRKDDADRLRMHYGLEGSKPMSFREIGDTFAMSKYLARYYHRRALKKLYRLMTGRCVNEPDKENVGNPDINGKDTSARAYQQDQRYADQHAFTGRLEAGGIIKRTRDDRFGRLNLDKADWLYRESVKHFLKGDGDSHRKLREILVGRFGEEAGGALFREAMKAKGVRIEFNQQIMSYFEASGSCTGSIVLDQNCVLPLDAVYSIKFNGGPMQVREFRKLLAQPNPPKSIFRMYLK